MKEQYQEWLRTGESEPVTVQTVLARSVSELLPTTEGLERLMLERPIKLYLGIDPTSPDLHIGHSVPLRKLREFQELGHQVHLLFGTFTGMIGDPTDKAATRKKLSASDVERNVATYVEQAGKILDMSENCPNPVKVVYNGDWLGKLNFADVVELAANFTVQQMLARSMFEERMKAGKPLGLHELLYPLMQGYDSVALGIDLEIGGSDQIFNMLVGRDLMAKLTGKEKWVLATKLIADPTGKKMGKTEGNIVNVTDPSTWKYEALMTWPDAAVPVGFELLTGLPLEDVATVKAMVGSDGVNITDLKRALAFRVVSELDGVAAATYSELEFDRVYRQKQLPSSIREVAIPRGTDLVGMLVSAGLVKDHDAARQLIGKRSVFVDGEVAKASYSDWRDGQLVSIGKRTIKNLRKVVIG